MHMLQRILEAEHPSLLFIQTLYEHSFPIRERREWQQLLSLLPNSSMQLNVVMDAGAYIGFVIGWTIGNWHFVEHFAIDPALRGKQYGSRVLQLLVEHAQRRLILEVEPAHDATAQRRIHFYERNGFLLAPLPYWQPPYRLGESPIPMQLMSMPAITSAHELADIASTIKATVYEAFY